MAINKELSSPRKGMNRDSAPFELGKEEYTYALNANIHDEHGNGKVILQNEPSNVKCSGFKPGYKVVGHKYDLVSEQTYFFLTNPTTGFSEIGVISSIQDAPILSPTEQVIGGNIRVVLETPLEQITQIASCSYTTLITDECISGSQLGSKCLNFSVDDPFHENNIQIKYGKRGKTLWFNHLSNPPRFVDLDNLESYTQEVDDCDDTITDICLDCEKMRVFPLFDIPCLSPRVIKSGGFLKAGVNEFLIAYSDFDGNELTDYYSITNPIPVFDAGNNILDQTTLDYQTNQAIGIDIFGLDKTFEYFKIAVIHKSGLDGAATIYAHGVYPIGQDNVTIYSLIDKPRLDYNTVISRRPFYEKAKGLAASNGYLYHYGLKTQREINLQPLVNLMGGFAKWATYQAKEDLYENGISVANYGSAMRDEVYPYSIKFQMIGGFESALFPLIARPPINNEVDEIDTEAYPLNDEVNSVLEYNPECFGNDRKYRWQFENTATETDDCLVEGYNTEVDPVPRTIESSCYVLDEGGNISELDSIDGSITVPDGSSSIISYINTHRSEILASSDPSLTAIKDILENPSAYEQYCDVSIPDSCSQESVTLVSEEMFPIAVDTEVVSTVDKNIDDYIPATQNSGTCSTYKTDTTTGDVLQDTAFITSYMNVGDYTYQRNIPTNSTCSSAVVPLPYSDPIVESSNYLVNKGEVSTITTLQDSVRSANITSSQTSVTITGTSGSANVNIDGVNYLMPWTGGSVVNTVLNFISLHAVAILSASGLVAEASGTVINLTGPYSGTYNTYVTNVSGDLNGSANGYHFTDKLHSNAVWYKIDFSGRSKVIFEIGTPICNYPDDNNSNLVRVLIFDNCSATSSNIGYGTIVHDITDNTDTTKLIELDSADFGGTSAVVYISIDSPIRSRKLTTLTQVNTLAPPCGCFSVFQRDIEKSTVISFTSLTFGKKQTYSYECLFSIPVLNNCEAVPFKKGLFSYWESTEVYPCNKELYDSSTLVISPSDIPSEFRTDFEAYYTSGLDGSGNYILNPETDFRDKPIRHYKYPDNNIAPYMSPSKYGNVPGPFEDSIIYPIGFNLSTSVINSLLEVGVKNGFITEEERSRIVSYEIYRGDRRVQKSVVAKGILFDMYKYEENTYPNTRTVFYPNYPLNSLGIDVANNNNNHPFSSDENNFFTFHSPDVHFGPKPTLPREMRIEGYLYGNSATYFDEVKDHPTYVLLGKKSRQLATTLAGFEIAVETLMQVSDYAITGAAGGVSAPAAIIAAAALGVGVTVALLFKAAEYRYRWLETLNNLGKPNNFAYYSASIGFYNVFRGSDSIPFQQLRGLTVDTFLKDGLWDVADENNHTTYPINNLDREYSVALHTGSYPIIYDNDYKTYDNAELSPITSSRQTYKGVGKSPKIIGNAASPYASLKQYNPSQYGTIDSVEWVNTGFCGSLLSTSDCNAAFGGDIFISRFSLKRKLPFFRTTAMGQAPLTPFKYSDYFNINPPVIGPDGDITDVNLGNRLFLDNLINDDNSTFVTGLNTVMPTNLSKYNLDSGGDDINVMYVKLPNKFYLYSYGIPHFLVESEINCSFRYAKREKHENFYPNISDIVEFTQEKNVSIREPNTFFYNFVYSSGHTQSPYRTLPQNFSQEISDRLNDLSNTVIYSAQDLSERSSRDPWLHYKALDTETFSNSYGTLISLLGIESMQILCRFVNGFTIFGAVDQMRDRLTPDVQNLGNGGIFAGRPVNFNSTRLGYAGTQHNATIDCEFGHIWADAKRGKVFLLGPGGKDMLEISKTQEGINSGLEKWFKENLPFKIQRYYPTINIDNNFNGIGLTMVWDDRLKRAIITKLDYIPISENLLEHTGTLYRTDGYTSLIAEYQQNGYTYEGIQGLNLVFYRPEQLCTTCDTINITFQVTGGSISSANIPRDVDGNFYFTIGEDDYVLFFSSFFWSLSIVGGEMVASLTTQNICPFGEFIINTVSRFDSFNVSPIICYTESTEYELLQRVDFRDPEYFSPCSWTVAYSPLLGTWISYYSYIPNYYIGYNDFFQSGINSDIDPTEFGLWSHLPYISSYQVFYGKLYPFIVEYPQISKLVNSRLIDVQYNLDVRKYYDKHNFTDSYGIGFNKTIVYNSFQNTGEMNLFHQKDDDLTQLLDFPRHNVSSIDILQTEINGKWSFNNLYNIIKDEKSGMPIWRENCAQTMKYLDNRLLNYSYEYRDYLRGDYFLVRLTNDLESRYKFLFRFAVDDREYYNQ